MIMNYFAWLSESAYCNCGGAHDGKSFVFGTVGGKSAKWKQCAYCHGSAIGTAWIYQAEKKHKGGRCACGNWLDGRNKTRCPNCGNRF